MDCFPGLVPQISGQLVWEYIARFGAVCVTHQNLADQGLKKVKEHLAGFDELLQLTLSGCILEIYG